MKCSVLLNTLVSQILPTGDGPFSPQRATLDAYDNIENALNILSKRNVSYAAIFDSNLNQYIGFVDSLDIVAYLIRSSDARETLLASGEEPQPPVQFSSLSVQHLIDASQCDPFVVVQPSASLLELAEIFADGVHRVAVMDIHSRKGQNCLMGVVTQMDMLHFLAQHLQEYGPVVSRSVSLLGLGSRDLITLREDMPAFQAFERISLFRISGAAVVDADGRIVDTLVASDMKGVDMLTLKGLSTPVADYLRPLRLLGEERQPLNIITQDTSFAECVKRMSLNESQRAWIVDRNQRPAAVASVTDVMSLVHLWETNTRLGA